MPLRSKSSATARWYQPAVGFADDVGLRDADILEEDLVEAVALGHVDQRSHGNAGRVHAHHEHRDALVLGRVRVGASGEPAPVGDLGAGGPNLLAVDHVVVTVLDGASLERGKDGARAGSE